MGNDKKVSVQQNTNRNFISVHGEEVTETGHQANQFKSTAGGNFRTNKKYQKMPYNVWTAPSQ